MLHLFIIDLHNQLRAEVSLIFATPYFLTSKLWSRRLNIIQLIYLRDTFLLHIIYLYITLFIHLRITSLFYDTSDTLWHRDMTI